MVSPGSHVGGVCLCISLVATNEGHTCGLTRVSRGGFLSMVLPRSHVEGVCPCISLFTTNELLRLACAMVSRGGIFPWSEPSCAMVSLGVSFPSSLACAMVSRGGVFPSLGGLTYGLTRVSRGVFVRVFLSVQQMNYRGCLSVYFCHCNE